MAHTHAEYIGLIQQVTSSIVPEIYLAARGSEPLATSAFLSGRKASERKDALDRLIRTGLSGEAGLDALILEIVYSGKIAPPHDAAVASLVARYPNGTFNTRQLIKLLGVDATYLLAASECAPCVGAYILAGYILDGNFLDWIASAGKPGKGAWSIAMSRMAGHGGAASLATLAAADPRLHAVMGALAPAPVTSAQHAANVATQAAHIVNAPNEGAPLADIIEQHTGVKPMNNTPASPIASALAGIQPGLRAAIEAMLQNSGAPGITLDMLGGKALEAEKLSVELSVAKSEADAIIAELQAKVRNAANAAPVAIKSTSGVMPNGTMKMVRADTIFPEMNGLKLDIPLWTWDAPHPDVPEKIDGYIFRRPLLARALRALAVGEGLWLHGHTGTGKTTFITQIANRLGWPVMRVAMDSAVDRSELVGRTQLVADGKGGTQSKWLPGVIERALPNGYIILFDELDASHPNSVYALQPVFERQGLTLLEDGGRVVPFHPMTRLVATGNTAGNGDGYGLYPACRILTAATLDRFPEFIEVPYLDPEEETALVRAATNMKAALAKKLAKFAKEMRAAFVAGELPVSYSPRRSIAFARAVEDYMAMLPAGVTEESAILLSLHGKLLQATPNEHRQRLTEIARNSLGVNIDPDKLNVPGLTAEEKASDVPEAA